MRFGTVCGLSVALAGLWASALTVSDWNRTKLNDAAVRDGDGNIIVLGTEGSWSDLGDTKEKAFDGDTATFFDPPSDASNAGPCWVGIELEEAQFVTRLRFFGRPNQKQRLIGCYFQGANQADFSDAVTLHTVSEADGWDGTNWGDVHVASEAALTPFKYLRFVGPVGTYAGNPGEIEFYGVTEAYMREKYESKTPEFTASYILTQLFINGHLTLGVGQSSRAPFYEVQRKPVGADESEYVDCGTIPFAYDGYTANAVPGYFFRDPTPVTLPTDYRIRSYNPYNGGSDWFYIGSFRPENIAHGTWIGPTGSWGTGNANSTVTDGEKAYDGNLETFVDLPDSKSRGGWTGLDLGAPATMKGARAYPRHNWSRRLEGTEVQVANELMPDPTGKSAYEFVDPVTVGTFTGIDETKIAEVVFDQPVTARYVRLKSREDATDPVFNTAEFEIDLSFTPQFAPALTVSMSNVEDEYAVLSWEPLDQRSRTSTVVFRANGPQGPWTELACLPAEATSYTDDTLAIGPRYYYGALYRVTVGDVDYDGPMSVQRYRRGRRLDRDPADETTLLPGIVAISNGTTWNNSGNGAPNVFDGDTATFADMNEQTIYVGLDMGTPFGISAVAAYPRAKYADRLSGAVIYGFNDRTASIEDWWNQAEPLTGEFSEVAESAWAVVSGISDGEYRYLGLAKPSKSNFYGNVTELRFYGWTHAEAMSVLTAPTQVTLTKLDGTIQIDWEVCGQATSYKVRRKVNDGDWEDIATEVLANTYEDTNTPFNGARYTYQIIAQGDSGSANSDPFSIIPYTNGNGTGLYGVYTAHFTHAYDPEEAVVLERIDPTVDFDWGTGGPDDSVGDDHFRVTWTGKIIIPFDGTYQFRMMQDDGARLIIDDTILLNDWNNYSGAWQTMGTIALTAGEHAIRIDTHEQVGDAYCRLFWGGCLDEEIVPSTQLIPEKIALDPVEGPWLGTRTLGGKVLGRTIFNGDGSVTISAGGEDTWNDAEGFRYLWQTFTGPFTCSMKVDFTRVPAGSAAARAMLMIRNDLPKGSPMFVAIAQANHTWNIKVRAGSLADGVAIQDLIGWEEGAADVCWFKVKRTQDLFIVSTKTAEDGEWSELFRYRDEAGVFNKTVYIGPAAGSGSDPVLTSTTFSDFTLSDEGMLFIIH